MVDENIGHVGQLNNRMEELKGMTASCSFHCILHQEALCAKSLNHVMGSCKNCDLLCAGAFNHHESVVVLEEKRVIRVK